MRNLALVALAGLLILSGAIWATAPSADNGRFLLKSDTPFTKGRFFAYVGPWGGQAVRFMGTWSSIADGIAIDLKRFPNNTTIMWRWPPINPSFGPGVWGYNSVSYDNYSGGYPEAGVPPIRVRDLKALRQSFRWTMSTSGEANVLTEFFLRSSATNVDSNGLEVGWFLHAPEASIRFFDKGRLVGTYVDASGRRWTVRLVDKFCMFLPEDRKDVHSGSLDMLHTLNWLKSRRLVTGDEWFWGFGIGAEPVRGMGQMTLHEWRVERR